MAISRIASGYAQATSASLSATPSVGDRIVDFAHRDGSNTAPSLASGFSNIENGGSNTNGLRASSKASAGTETSTGTCANATSVGGVAYRGLDPQVPFGAIDQTGGTGTSLTFPSLTLQVGDGSSWVAACGAHRTATNVNANAPSLTLVGSGVADLGVSDSNGGVSSYAGGSQTVNASSGWRTAVVELVAQQSTAVPSQLVQSSATYSNLDTETGNDFICQLHAASGANNSIVVFVNYEAPAGGVTRALTISGIGGSVTATAVAGPVTGNGVITAGYLIEGVASGITALKFHFTDNGTPVQVNSFHATYGEYSGVATSSALRAANANASAGGGAGPTLALQPGNLSVTAGDVVVVFTLSNGWGPSLRGATVTGWRAAPGYHLLHADRDIGIATMVGEASATGTINPAIYCADSATDTFACLAIALKGSPGSGTPGASTRVLTSTHTYFAQAGTALVSAPINGDAQVIIGAHGNGLVAITSANGSGAGAYTVNAPTGNRPQCVYAAGLTQDSTNLATLTLSPTNAGWQCVIYDLVGIDPTTPFDQVASASSTGSFTGPGDINTGSVTPTNAGAVVLTALRVTGGPIDSMSGPAGVVYDAPYYTGQTDSSVMDLGEGYGHLTNAPASSLTFLWHSASTPDWDWSAFVFNAAAGGGGPTNTPMTISVTQTQTASRARGLTPGAKSATSTQAPSRVRAVGRTLSAAQAQSPARMVALARSAMSANVAQAPARARAVAQAAKAVSVGQVPSVNKSGGRVSLANQAQAPAAARTVTPVAKAATSTQAPSVTKGQGFFKTLSGSISQTLTRALNVGETRSANQSSTSSASRTLGATKATTSTATPSRARAVTPNPKQASSAQSPSLVKGQGFLKALSAAVTQIGARAVAVGRTVAGTGSGTPTLGPRAVARSASASVAQALSSVRSAARTIAANQVQSGSSQQNVSGNGNHLMTLSAAVSQAVTMVRGAARALALGNAQAPTVTKAVTPPARSATQAQAPSMAKGGVRFVNVSGVSTQTPTMRRALGAVRSSSASQSIGMSRAAARLLSVTSSYLATFTKSFSPPARSATQAQAPSVTKGSVHFVSASAASAQTPAVSRTVGAVRSVTTSQAPSFLRAFGRSFVAEVTQLAQVTRSRLLTFLATVLQTASETHEAAEPTVVIPPFGRTAEPEREVRFFRPQPGATVVYNVVAHDAAELKDYGFDFSDIIENGETITSLTWDAPFVLYGSSSAALPTVSRITLTGTLSTFWATGVQDGITYAFVAHLTTNTGRSLSFTYTVSGWQRQFVHRFRVEDPSEDLDYAIDAAASGLLLGGELLSDVSWADPVVLYGTQAVVSVTGHTEQHSPIVAKKSFTGVAANVTYLVAVTLTTTSGRVYVRKLTLAG